MRAVEQLWMAKPRLRLSSLFHFEFLKFTLPLISTSRKFIGGSKTRTSRQNSIIGPRSKRNTLI